VGLVRGPAEALHAWLWHWQVRRHLGTLGRVLQQRSGEARASHLAHQVTLGASALEAALVDGRPFAGQLAQLARTDDELLAVALRALPEGLAEQVRGSAARSCARQIGCGVGVGVPAPGMRHSRFGLA
jgi:hypothetical protein